MTGFGIAEYNDEQVSLRVEIRSVNNKFLKIYYRLPEILQSFESELERQIRKKIIRGSIVLNINYRSLREESEYIISHAKVKEYYHLLNDIKKDIGSKEKISINSLLLLPGILQKNKGNEEDVDSLLSLCLSLINEALDKLQEMRIIEGKHIEEDITQRKNYVISMLKKFEERAPVIVKEYCDRLQNRVAALLSDTDITLTDNNLCREVAIFAERCDISEEISRLKSHLQQLQDTTQSDEPVGRKLDFIVQEMFRETNTMCSKANDSVLLKDLVNIKTEIEKIREQVFNIE